MLLVVAGNITANIFIKLGADEESPRIFGILSLNVAIGITIFAVSFLFYAWSLRYMPLYLAQSIATLQFIGVILAAAFLFDETIAFHQWFGISLIALGIFIIFR